VIPLLAFDLDGQCYALPLGAVERIVRIVSVTPLPSAPEVVAGVINVHGRIIPVVDLRKRFRLPPREIVLSDQLIIAHTSRRPVALMADSASGVVECAEQDVVTAEAIVPRMQYVSGAAMLRDGIVLIHDLDSVLSLDEDQALTDAMSAA
jgi:purine-binding chemotaxis protein CheW